MKEDDLDPKHLTVLNFIKSHTASNPIKVVDLSRAVGVSHREIWSIISELRWFGFKIASSRVSPAGYFYGTATLDMIETVRPLKTQALTMLKLCKKLLDFSGQEPTLFDQPILDEIADMEDEINTLEQGR